MMIRAAFLIGFLTVASNVGYACINGAMTALKSGFVLYEDGKSDVPEGHEFWSDEEQFVSAIRELDSLFAATKDLDYLSDKGIIFIITGQYDKAIELYLEIEKLQPNRYATASNIGTAYELAGQNENALIWIKRAVEIDSTSHFNSEWIHVKILEAKIKGEKYYTAQFLLNKDFGDDKIPTSDMDQDALEALASALFFQLHERVTFVKPKEKIVAQLLFDLGNVEFLRGRYAVALADYEKAKAYGYEGDVIESRMAAAKKFSDQGFNKPPVTNTDNSSFGYILIGAAAFIVLGAAYKKWREDRE